MSLKPWISAARPKTLPLALSNVILGSAVAYRAGKFSVAVFLLGLITTLLLQILSNYANDYGDFVNKADDNRVSKYERALKAGTISTTQMKRVLAVLSLLIFLTGSALVAIGLKGMPPKMIIGFIAVGIVCILAAITYTVGKNPYGYYGFGDISVFIFFGLVAVCGIFILHTKHWDNAILLPACCFGLLSVGVLNINNIRDISSDQASGKRTLVVRMGETRAKIYHAIIISTALALAVVFTILKFRSWKQWLFVLVVPFFVRNIYRVWRGSRAEDFDDELKNLSLTSFAFVVLYGAGLVL